VGKALGGPRLEWRVARSERGCMPGLASQSGGVQRLAGGGGVGDLTAWTLIGRLLAQKSAEAG